MEDLISPLLGTVGVIVAAVISGYFALRAATQRDTVAAGARRATTVQTDARAALDIVRDLLAENARLQAANVNLERALARCQASQDERHT